ncbi:hypothetical protein YC2023_023462 [Brassica napus]
MKSIFLFGVRHQVVRVIVIQKTLIEYAEKLRQVKAVLEEVIFSQQRTFWNGAERKSLRDLQEGSTEAAEVSPINGFGEIINSLRAVGAGGVGDLDLIKAGRRGRRPMPNNPMPAECKHIDDCVAPLINVAQRNGSYCCNAFKRRESIQCMRTLFASNDRFIRFGTVGICKAICPELSNCSYRPKTYRPNYQKKTENNMPGVEHVKHGALL